MLLAFEGNSVNKTASIYSGHDGVKWSFAAILVFATSHLNVYDISILKHQIHI